MLVEENEILKRLKTFPPNAVYSIAPKEFFLRGFDYYERQRLESFSWSKGQSVLIASVRGTRLYSVLFSIEDDTLSISCDCPAWAPSFQCKHVVCALLTAINLFSPNLFRTSGQTEERLRLLESSLSNRPLLTQKKNEEEENQKRPKRPIQKRRPYQIVFAVKDGRPTVSVRKNGAKIEAYWGIPSELTAFVTSQFYASSYFSQNLSRYFSSHGNAHPLIFSADGEETEIRWDPSLKYEGKTEIDVFGDRVRFRPVFFSKELLHEKGRRLWNMAVDLETKTAGIVKETAAWDLYDAWERLFSYPDPLSGEDDPWSRPALGRTSFETSLKRFQSAQILAPRGEMNDFLGRLILKIDGEPAPIRQAKHAYRLTIDPTPEATGPGADGAPQCLLRAECRLGESAAAPTESAFHFFSFLETDRNVSAAMKARKRRSVLYALFFKLLSIHKKSEAERIVRESLSEGDFSRFKTRSEAKRILKHFLSAYSRADARLQYGDGRWAAVPNDKAREALLYRIPFEMFGPDLFKGTRSHDEMSIGVEPLHEQLPLLHSKLKEAGIELFYRNKPVAISQWDFSFDARRPAGVDWFEIRPEIRCDGALLDEAAWLGLLGGGGAVEQDDSIRILDANAREILKSLSVIYKSPNSQRRGKQGGTLHVQEIVRTPRLQILNWIALRRQGVKVKLSDEDEALFERLTHFDKIEKALLPKKLRAKLRPYQKEGYDWLAFLYRHRFGACLADDMGLGKTLQAITLLAGIKEGAVPSPSQAARLPHLIVLPPSLLFNWENEIVRFYPDLKICFYTGKERNTDFRGAEVVMTTYALVRRDIEKLKEIPFHVIIFDEAQAVKNIYAGATGAVRRLKGHFKLVMTGTPLENHVGEYYSLIDLSLPGLLGPYDDFKSQIHLEQSPLLDLIIRRTRPFVLRRTKEKILEELPPKIETDVYLDLTPEQKGLYQLTVSQTRSKIDEAYRSKTGVQAQIIALTAILKLRQICVSPRLIAPEIRSPALKHFSVAEHQPNPSPKIDFLIGRLKELLEAGHSALVFSQFTSFLDIVEEALNHATLPFLRLDGSTATAKRKSLVEGFQEGANASIFLLSLKAGGQGLNLTKASYVFHLDPWWNPAVENQASDRAHRIGQKNKVSITRILMRHTIEEKMMALKKKKLALYQAVMGDDTKGRKTFSISKEDFDFLLGE